LALVTSRLDGDTFACIDNGRHVRVAEIQAAERGQPLYIEARNKLRELVNDQQLLCVETGINQGRIVAVCLRYKDGLDVGRTMIQHGLARRCPIFGDRYAEVQEGPGAHRIPLPLFCTAPREL
jgi:endonuclease YncB( thermonuclease family)